MAGRFNNELQAWQQEAEGSCLQLYKRSGVSEPEVGEGCKLSKLNSSDVLPPARLHIPHSPPNSQGGAFQTYTTTPGTC